MIEALYIAVDLGASSGRVVLAGVAPGEWRLEEVRRFRYPATVSDGHLRWDLPHIFNEIKAGLGQAGQRARELGRRIQSIGIDSWGVDYGLIDGAGQLIENPICYRDERTQGVMDRVFERISRAELFARTGVQFQAFNTLFQVYTHVHDEGIPAAAEHLLLIPDLVNFFLTGRAVTEYTNATTTQMVRADGRSWDVETQATLGLPAHLLAEIVFAGTTLGPLTDPLAEELDLRGVKVVVPATHDTGSAVVGAPLEPGWAYISSGTWSLIGVELDQPLINDEVARQNFTNEGGAFDTVRFLKNVTGMWLLASCQREWGERGIDLDHERLLREVVTRKEPAALIFPDDPRFFNPSSMLEAIAGQLRETAQTMPDDPVMVTKAILDSLALRYAAVLKVIESLTGKRVEGLQIVGGGSLNDHLNQMTANAANLPVAAGPAEAAVTGNVLVQAIAAGRFASLGEARHHIAQNIPLKRFAPATSPALRDAQGRYAEIEARFVN